MIKAIETRYKGYRFRSRLEARWAVFFDALGYEWKYELEGYEANGVSYLPDFYLPKSKTFVEVKGSDEMLQADAEKLEAILDYSSPLPGIMDSDEDEDDTRGLLILGEIPWSNDVGLFLHRIIRHRKGLWFKWAMFNPVEPEVIKDYRLLNFFKRDGHDEHYPNWSTKAWHIDTVRSFALVNASYAAARAARFEHGETPSF